MSAALDAARKAAAKAAEALRTAEAKAQAEQAAVRDRNSARRATFWSDAAERCKAARSAAQTARATVVDLVATGELAEALTAYAEYVRRVVELQAITGQAEQATAEYVWTEAQQVAPDAEYRRSYGGRLNLGQPALQIERVERRQLVTEYHRDRDEVPPGDYRREVPTECRAHHSGPDPLATLLAEGQGRLEQAHAAVYTAELLAPLHAQLEHEDA